jgi:hypothetical protein
MASRRIPFKSSIDWIGKVKCKQRKSNVRQSRQLSNVKIRVILNVPNFTYLFPPKITVFPKGENFFFVPRVSNPNNINNTKPIFFTILNEYWMNSIIL